jgi:hypothetical protein
MMKAITSLPSTSIVETCLPLIFPCTARASLLGGERWRSRPCRPNQGHAPRRPRDGSPADRNPDDTQEPRFKG